ncbi:hypothetical protein PPYR_06601 [Photinus pyralis]|uniref:DNA-directed RNA polymerase subunit n=1 Tax=Photinus pyralis TaxID=7054 RepID=A0A1Y1MPW4_PHOPY|nr:hypothetical protein PPYR_12122 [Photinus pyralis]KAB0800862.1 hypothetical protein PPYR_06601 [Photinus pyralis]
MENKKSEYTFVSSPNFCSDCGSILPLLGEVGDIICYRCTRRYSHKEIGSDEIKYTIHFNSIDACTKNLKEENRKETEEEGPVVERKCPKCGNDKMSYATVQLRSADEGQTVFYTCTKCKFKENENS